MSKHLIAFFVFIMSTTNIMAQYNEQTLVVCHPDGTMSFHACERVDSITYSYYDIKQQLCDHIVTQQIHLSDTIIRIPLEEIDSMMVVTLPSYCPDANHPHAIDLGLSSGTKWACCNIGASVPEGYGGYYSWGEMEEKDSYEKDNYTFADASRDEDEFDCLFIGFDISKTEYDVAYMKWGENWCMPSKNDFEELVHNCSFELVNHHGVNGILFHGHNGNCVFLPAAGWQSYKHVTGDVCSYWTSNAYNELSQHRYAWFMSSMFFGNSTLIGIPYNDRFVGRSVRAVSK